MRCRQWGAYATSNGVIAWGAMVTMSPAKDEELSGPREAAAVIRVMVVDDHALVREGTAQILSAEADLEVVGQTGNAEEGFALFEQVQPDVLLVDVNLPGASGLEFARQALRLDPTVRIIVVSAYDDYAYVTEALEIGVSGYLLKTASGNELVDAVRAAADGVFVLDRALSARLTRRWRSGPSELGALTARETDVLHLLSQGLSNKHIATQLGLRVRTVEGHVSSVLAKLGVDSRTGAALYALDHHLFSGENHDE